MSNLDTRIGTAALVSAATFLIVGFNDCAALAQAEKGAAARSNTAQTAGARYRDGVYTATGQYGNGPSSLTVTVTLARDVITNVEVQTPATNPVSLVYQRRFAAAVPAVVVGRPISQLKVGRLAGSSVTPNGFNAALAAIKKQAAR